MVNIYLKTTIRAPRRGDASSMYLVEYVSDRNPEKMKTWPAVFTDLPDTTENILTLVTLIKALSRFTKPTQIRIFTNAQGVFGVLESRNYAVWRSQKWRGASQNIIKNNELWEILIPLLELHEWTVTTDGHSFEKYMESELKKWHSQ